MLDKIVVIKGKSGIFKVLAENKSSIIVENIEDKKQIAMSLNIIKMNFIKDIYVYTYDDVILLKDVFLNIYKKQEKEPLEIDIKNSQKLKKIMREVVTDYDEERVYISDIKKIINWYNILQRSNLLEEKKVVEKSE